MKRMVDVVKTDTLTINEERSKEEIVEELERTKWKRVGKTLAKDWRLYALLIPLLVFLVLLKYRPIYGVLQAFKNADNIALSVMDQNWYGLRFAKLLLNGDYAGDFFQAFRNTFVNSAYGLCFGFPLPIFLALLFSEVKNKKYRSVLQVCSYLPKFISTVVITTIIFRWSYQGNKTLDVAPGLLANIFLKLGWYDGSTDLINTARFFRPIYQVSDVWESCGYGSIVYFAAIIAISPANYEAAKIDGASKLQEIKYVTLPGMAPTLSIMLITRIGSILNIGYEKIILLWNGNGENNTRDTADVISTFVYRFRNSTAAGMRQAAVAADLFNSFIAMFLVLGANAISRRVSDTALF